MTFENYTVWIDHDLWILDYLSDIVWWMYGIPGVYGTTTLNKWANDGINMLNWVNLLKYFNYIDAI